MRRLAALSGAAVLASATSTAEARHTPWPAWWHTEAMCIHRAEAVNWHERRNRTSRGGFQFLFSTWQTVLQRHHLAFPDDPADATVFQQTLAAWYRWLDAGRVFSDWLPYDHAYYCVT